MKGPKSQRGTVVLSIDVPAEDATGGRVNDKLARKLFHMVDSRHLSASWVPQAPQQFSLREELAAPNTGHDLALVGDSSWIGKAAGRTRFARELAARVEAVRSTDINVVAIALRDAKLDENLDLLVKHRVGMIRGGRRGGEGLQPQSVRFGVWYSPITVVLPQPNDWSWFGKGWSLRQSVRHVIRAAGVAHFVIDGARMEGNTGALDALDLVLAHLQRQRDKKALAVTSMSGLTKTLIRKPTVKKATSILRAA
jgi:hypothetical protein